MSLPDLSFADVVQPAWNVSPRVRAPPISPEVSLSSRCTMPARGKPAAASP